MIARAAIRLLQPSGLPIRPTARGEHPQRHLKPFRGALQADAFAGFNALYEKPASGICEAACWAHVRRKFYDLQQAHASPVAAEALRRIGELYAIEAELRGRAPDERRQIRQTRARPLLDSMHEWLRSTLVKLQKKSPVTSAIGYALELWTALTRYCDDGQLEIDNNAAERALRAVALGRKNFLFAGSDSGGRSRCVDLQPDRNSQAERSRSGSLPARRARSHR